MTVHCSRRQQSTVKSQHHSGVTGNDITWLPKIRDRALFDASGYVSAIEPLKLCEQDFQQLSQQVYDAQDLFETPLGTTS
ncbi:hypothetical protein [Microcoleus sp. LAD1_D5]|uniref:hypothetical protein n=1 Tax=Microcoleus sp. LAD1_D5 TaxID=2818813 RepID=UPI002FD0406B